MRPTRKHGRGAALLAGVLLLGLHASAQAPAPAAAGGEAGASGTAPRGRYPGMGRVAGEVTAINGGLLTLREGNGKSTQVVTTDNTRIMKGSGPVRITDLHVGDGVMAMGNLDAAANTLHAAVVFAEDAAQVKAMKENLGKTYITGRVKAVDMDDARLTVERGDGKAQTIGLDETTSFRRAVRGGRGNGGEGGNGSGGEGRGREGGLGGGDGMAMRGMGTGLSEAMDRAFSHGESITLADIKVGDFVSGTGGLKGGMFVPTKLLDVPAGMRRGRAGEGAPGAGAEGSQPDGITGPGSR